MYPFLIKLNVIICQIKYLFSGIVFFLTAVTVDAQNRNLLNNFDEFNKADSSKLFFRLENFNFIKNKEYHSYFIKGETLLGYLATPKLVYYPSSKIRIEAGIRLQKYFGNDGLAGNEPVFTFMYRPNKKHTMIIGALNQNGNHQLSEPMFNPEFYFTKNIENGIQYQYNGDRLYFDTWINWKQFIFEGDPFQEKLAFGVCANLWLNKKTAKNRLSIPFEMLANHEGGQIDTSPDNVMTKINMASGLKWEHKTTASRIKLWYVKMMAYFFTNSLSKRDYLFKNGYALYPTFGFATQKSKFSIGYYTPYHFETPNASILFSSSLYPEDKYFSKRNNLLTAKYQFSENLTKGIDLGAEINTYYQFTNHKLHYDFAVYVSMNLDFFLKKLVSNI